MKFIKAGDKGEYVVETKKRDKNIDDFVYKKIKKDINGTHTIDSFNKLDEGYFRVNVTCLKDCKFNDGKFTEIN